MSVFGILFERLLERRLLRDGEADASLLPGTFTTLGASTFISGLLIDQLPAHEIALVIVSIVFVWSFLKAFLEAQEFESQAVEFAVLTPLPIAPFQILAARAGVIGVGLLLTALNLSLPAAVMLALVGSVPLALGLLLAAAFSAALGLGVAQALRRLLTKVLSPEALSTWEGPIQLLTALGILVLVVVAPDYRIATLLEGPWRFAPPLSFVLPIAGLGREAWPVALAGGLFTLGLLTFVVFSAESTPLRTENRRAGSAPRFVRSFARALVDPVERAGFEFCVAQIRSDRVFRTRVYPLFAFPFAAILLAYLEPDDRTMIPMACFGTTVYLVLAEVFFAFSEGESGPRWLASLPFTRLGAYRVGTEKAFLVMLVLPVHVALLIGTSALTLLRGTVSDLVSVVLLNAMAFLASCAIVLVTFERSRQLPFSVPDRGLYSEDISSGAFLALLLAAGAALAIVPALANPWVLALEAAVLCLMIRLVLAWKRRRWNTLTTDPNPK